MIKINIDYWRNLLWCKQGDTVYIIKDFYGDSKIRFGEGITREGLFLDIMGHDLIINFSNSNDYITVKDCVYEVHNK